MYGLPNVPFASQIAGAIASIIPRDLIPIGMAGVGGWGVYSGGAPVIVADTVLEVSSKSDYVVSDFPVEKGGFAAYNKVATPFDARVRFAAGGTMEARLALLSSLEAIAGTTQLFDVVTPEKVFPNATIVHHDHRRAPNEGLGLLIVDVWLLEVRETATATAGKATASADAATQVNGGSVQATPSSAPTRLAVATNGRVAGPV